LEIIKEHIFIISIPQMKILLCADYQRFIENQILFRSNNQKQ